MAIKKTISIWVCVLLILTMLFTLPATAATTESERSPTVILRTSLEPDANLVVGQQVQFHVDLLVDTWFSQAPQVPELKIPGAITLLPVGTSVNFSERIQGKSYSGQRRSYYIFPQKQGEYQIPPLQVSLVPAQPGKLSAEKITLSTPAQKFTTQLPFELAKLQLDYALATPQLTLEDSFDRDLTGLNIGDTFQRTVTVRGTDILGSVLPSLDPGNNDGLAAYPQGSKIDNYFDRGRLTGKRSESVTYVVEQPGKYNLPEIRVVWWNTSSQSLQTEVINAISVKVSPSLEYLLKKYAPVLIIVAVIVLGLGIWAWKYRQSIAERLEAYRQSRRESESAYFNRFHQACLANEPQQSFNCLIAWLERTDRRAGTVTVEQFTAQVNNPRVSQQVQELEEYLFAPEKSSTETQWSGLTFYQAIASIRKEWLQQQGTQQEQQSHLPSLNPS